MVAFLLLSPQFPRSVLFGLQAAGRALDRIEGREVPANRPQRLLGRLRADVQYADVDEVMEEDLGVYLGLIEAKIRQVSEAIEVTYFRSSDELSLHVLDPAVRWG